MSDAIRLSSVTVNCPDLGAAEQRVLHAGAVKFDFQPNAEHCLVFADPVGHPFCLTTIDDIG